MKPLLLKHLGGESIGRFPVWMMRQAGRYLPSYRAIRKEHSFWEMVTQPDIATKVSLLPLDVLPVDGVIFFSDILTPPYGMGMPIEMKETIGPVITKPLTDAKAFEVFRNFDPQSDTKFVGETLQAIRNSIKPETTLLGFAGAPWTVGSYLIEGHGKTHFEKLKAWTYQDPASLEAALKDLADSTVAYLKYQVKSGAQLVQLFDTWLSEMPYFFYKKHYEPMLNAMFAELKKENIPTIYFAKASHHLFEDFQRLNVQTLSIDERMPLSTVDKRTGGKFSLQGNLDPILLLSSNEATVRQETRKLVAEARKLSKPAIINLGHGILPLTPVENAKAFIQEAREMWL